jgi:S1-C subfamily serine protease
MKLSAMLTALGVLAGTVSLGVPAAARVPAHSAPVAKRPPSPAKQSLLAHRETVAQATVTIPAKSCAGFVAQEKTWVVTAAHCIPEGPQRFDVKLRDGTLLSSSLAYLDREHDLAALRLDQPAPVVPLALGERMPAPGAHVLFVGRVDRRLRPQVAKIERIDQCPSLPDVSNALFTTLEARPGDSGAPVVDRELKVVGAIHGGARCHISAPTVGLSRELSALGSSPAPSAPPNSPPAPDADPSADEKVLKRYQAGPFVLEKIPNGFKFRFSFRWGSDK